MEKLASNLKTEDLNLQKRNEEKCTIDTKEMETILNNQQRLYEMINDVSLKLIQQNTISDIKADEQSLTEDENGILKIKDIAKTNLNNLGTSYVYDNKMPCTLKENTRYVITNNIQDTITLPSGSKIVPNGGFPLNGINGGEDSWVHSSDIGMIQDDGSHNISSGKYNRNIFEALLKTNYNLILDGDYFIYLYANKFDTNLCLQLTRDFKIKNGRLFIKDAFLTINKNVSFIAENVIFERTDDAYGYPAIYLKPDGGLINNIEFNNCKFFSNKSYRRFLRSSVKTTCPSNMISFKLWDEYFVDKLGYKNAILNESKTYVYAFPNDYKKLNDNTIIDKDGNKVDEKNWDKIATEKHPTSYFAVQKDNNGNVVFVKSDLYTDTYNNIKGYFAKKEDVTYNDTFYIIDEKFSYIEDDTIEKVENMGVDTFIMRGCQSDNTYFELGDLMFKTKFEVSDSTFTNIKSTGFNLGTTNDKPYTNDWAKRSCQYVFLNDSFSGPNYVINKTSDTYTCAILSEGNSILVKGCRIKNLVSNRWETYECYLSSSEVIFEDNYIYNVFGAPRITERSRFDGGGYEWMKSKAGGFVNGRNPVRMYRNNHYEINYETAWEMCKDYLQKMYTDENDDIKQIFDTYCMRQRILGFVTKAMITLCIEGNVFKVPDGKLVNFGQSGRNGLYREINFNNNVFDFKKYDYDFSSPLIAIRKTDDNYPLTVVIKNNQFKSKERSVIQLLNTEENSQIDKLYIQNNTFDNMSFKIANYNGGVGKGNIKANQFFISDNIYNCPNGVENVLSHLGKVSLNNNLSGDLLKCDATDYYEVNLFDGQKYNEDAECSKIIQVPTSNGSLCINIPYMKRTLSLNKNSFTDSLNNKSLAFYWKTSDNMTYGIDITYTFKGKEQHKHMELAHTSSNSYFTTVLRDYDGVIHGLYTTKGFTFADIPSLEDIGLGIFCEGYNTSGLSGDFTMHFYTVKDTGSCNDSGTDIKINIKRISESGIFTPNKAPVINNLTPMSYFIDNGSAVSKEWLESTIKGMEYKGSSKMMNVKVMTKYDIGLRVYCDNEWYTWNGEEWMKK